MNATLKTIRENLNASGPHVGDIVWWSLFDSQVSAEWFTAEWKTAGLEEELLPSAMSPLRALKDAGLATVSRVDGKLFRLAANTDAQTIYALVQEERKGDGTVEYHQEAQIAVDHIGGAFHTDAPANTFVQAIRAKYETFLGAYSAREVRTAILRAFDRMAAVSIRETGGVYWIPAPYAETGRRLKTVVEKVGGSSFSVLPVHQTSIGNEALGHAAHGALEAELVELKEEITQFAAEPPRAATLERRLDAFAALQSRATLYRDLLAVEVGDLEAKLGELTESVTKILGSLESKAA